MYPPASPFFFILKDPRKHTRVGLLLVGLDGVLLLARVCTPLETHTDKKKYLADYDGPVWNKMVSKSPQGVLRRSVFCTNEYANPTGSVQALSNGNLNNQPGRFFFLYLSTLFGIYGFC